MEFGLRVVLALVTISILIYVTYYLLKIVNKKMFGRKGEFLKVIDVLPLSQDSMLVLVEIGDRVILLGKTQKSITFLKEFSKEQLLSSDVHDQSFKEIMDDQMYTSFELKDRVKNLYNLIKDNEGNEDDEKK